MFVLKTIVRNFTRKPVTNLINLLGLSLSLTLVIILSVYCYSELTTDNFHSNGSRVYLYGFDDHLYTPGVLKEHIDNSIPGVESAVRIGGTWEAPVFQVGDKEPIISDLIFADEGFFKLFSYRFIEGNSSEALNEPMTVVITKTLENKLFGNEKALGKIILLNNDKNLTVSGVIEEPDARTCLKFSAVTNIATRKIVQENGGEYTEWGWCDFQTFLLLKDGTDPVETGKAILLLFPKEDQKGYQNVKLTPLKSIYFSNFSLLGTNYLINGDRRKIRILLLVAFLVLIIALINFINISSSQWQEKIKQTGVMKVLGATRYLLLRNTITESFLFFLAALVIAVELVGAASPFIKEYTGIQYSSKIITSILFSVLSLTVIFVLSFIFSIIPALKISSSAAVDNLKKTVWKNKSNFSVRGILVTLQFIIAIVLISFTFLVQKQVRFGSSNLGFNQSNILGIRIPGPLNQKKEVLRNLLEQKPAVKKVSFSQYFPGKLISSWGTQLNQNGEKKKVSFDTFSADTKFFEILGLQLISGRLYDDNDLADKKKIVVNETFIRENRLTYPLNATINIGMMGEQVSTAEIIGVVKDFHYKSLNQPIASLAIRNDSYASYCIVTVVTSDFKSLKSTVDDIKVTVSELSPSIPTEVSFFDDAIKNMYQSELRFRRTFSLFAVSAIIICCMGILAMSIFASQRRVKEIGIRKVNGAKIYEIMLMLNEDLVKWVGIAFIIACPIAWYIMHRWLDNFAYKTKMSWWIFAVAGIIALGIALLTVSWQSWRAANRNPVEALRYE
ncbi:MAG TPA: ABC transporter permease [Bacteroidales bacterium]|nr:ABC transporter permease [Bacteroidales bacterium]